MTEQATSPDVSQASGGFSPETLSNAVSQVANEIFDRQEAPSTAVETDAPAEVGPEADQEAGQVEAAPDDQPATEPAKEAASDGDSGEVDVPAKVDAPSELPKAIRDQWGNIPEDARAEVERWHRDTQRKLTEQGRQVHGIAPIRDVLEQAVKDLPGLRGMKPAEVASEVMQLARFSNEFQSRPVETLMQIVDNQPGLRDAMARALGATVAPGSTELAELRRELATMRQTLDPRSVAQAIRAEQDHVTRHDQALSAVNEFRANAKHWDAVEGYLPEFVQISQKINPDADTMTHLRQAYRSALTAAGLAEEPEVGKDSAKTATVATPPSRTEAARRAASANVSGKAPAKPPAPRTLDEAIQAAAASVFGSQRR